MSLPAFKVGICPYCLNINSVEKSNLCCYYWFCITCKYKFDICCSSKREVSLAHGNQYHRPSCIWFNEYDDSKEGPVEDCPYCKKLGKKCPRPKDLVNNDIPKEEWEFNKEKFEQNDY